MDHKSPQFTAYDLLGYLMPGLAFLALVDCSVAFHLHKIGFTYEAVTNRYMAISWQASVPLALLGYYVGHLVSFLSSMSIERYARWRYGHPMKFLLDTQKNYPKFFATEGISPWYSKLLRLITAIALAPISIIESLLLVTGILRNYIRSMGDDLASVVNAALQWLRNKAGMVSDPSIEYPSEFESLAINYTLEFAPSHVFTLRNYVVLYGFLRSMTLILVLVTWVVSFHLAKSAWVTWNCPWVPLLLLVLSISVGGILCTISYGAFLKFWIRYNKEALMGLTAVYLKDQSFSQLSRPVSEPIVGE